MTVNTFAGMGAHQSSSSQTNSWITPPAIIEALGGADSFDLDPCADVDQAFRTALQNFTVHDNGLLQAWTGRVWLNPPYQNPLLGRFMARMALHNRGAALIFARTDTEAFHRYVWERAAGVLFLRGRLTFHRPDGSLPIDEDGNIKNSGAPSVLIAYGQEDLEILSAAPIDGAFVPLRFPPMFSFTPSNEGEKLNMGTWMEVIEAAVDTEPMALADIYRAVADHPKAQANQFWREKVRQMLQRGKFERVEKGIWQRRAA